MQLLRRGSWLGAAMVVWLAAALPAQAWFDYGKLDRVNRRICGRVLDFTHNHGCDNRLWSEALCQYRDLYVYLPPGFDPNQLYPVMLWLHGVGQDEVAFLEIAEKFDRAIVCGQLPPLIVAAPDGSVKGRPSAGSFFIDSDAGRFEQYLIRDVWSFVTSSFPVRPEREAHVLAGASMGGFAAYNQGFKHPKDFGVLVGILPPLNGRWMDCHCCYQGNFDPCCWGWRLSLPPNEVIGRFYCGLVPVRIKRFVDPLFFCSGLTAEQLALQNPLEMMIKLDLKPGRFQMFVGYGGKDEFNIDAQVESFLYVARQRGLEVGVAYDPDGKHSTKSAFRLFPYAVTWLAPRIAPYSPPWQPHP